MYDLIIKNGFVVSPSSTVKCDIAIDGKKLLALEHIMMQMVNVLSMQKVNMIPWR